MGRKIILFADAKLLKVYLPKSEKAISKKYHKITHWFRQITAFLVLLEKIIYRMKSAKTYIEKNKERFG